MEEVKYLNVHEAAKILGYGHIESFRRAVRIGWLNKTIHPVPGRDVDGFHANSVAYPAKEIYEAAGL
jgi:hypothetical protein